MKSTRLRGSDRAVLIPIEELPARSNQLEPYRNSPLIVHCHHGARSQMVTEWLRSMGFSQARHMVGGIDAWSQLVDSSVPRY
jgi:rhodanese-related sulfurtransferase